MTSQTQHESKTEVLNAPLEVIGTEGNSATTVEHHSGRYQSSFFHHFNSKNDLAGHMVRHETPA